MPVAVKTYLPVGRLVFLEPQFSFISTDRNKLDASHVIYLVPVYLGHEISKNGLRVDLACVLKEL